MKYFSALLQYSFALLPVDLQDAVLLRFPKLLNFAFNDKLLRPGYNKNR